MALSGLSIAQEASNGGSPFYNEIDVVPAQTFDSSGTNYASVFTDFGAITVRLSFDALNAAFGAESWGAASNEIAVLEVFDGATLLGSQALTSGAGDFLGYVLSGGDTASSVRYRSLNVDPRGGGETFGLDNLAGVDAAPGAVPEPTTLALVGLAMLGLRASRRR